MKTVEAMDKKAAAQMLEQIASFLELRGENPFRIRAFRAAARAVGSLSSDLPTALEDGSLAGTKGIGPATLQIITELATTGQQNREIAQALFVTTPTVEFHLRNAYRKLGIASRTQLAGALRG